MPNWCYFSVISYCLSRLYQHTRLPSPTAIIIFELQKKNFYAVGTPLEDENPTNMLAFCFIVLFYTTSNLSVSCIPPSVEKEPKNNKKKKPQRIARGFYTQK